MNNWIDADKHLPLEDIDVLALVREGDSLKYRVVWLDKNMHGEQIWDDGRPDTMKCDVAYWMPLPAKPKGANNE